MSEDIRKMIDKVKNFKQFVNENVNGFEPIIIKSKKNELFFINIYFDDKGRVDKIENKWDVKLPEWYGFNINKGTVNDWIRRKEPDLYVVD